MVRQVIFFHKISKMGINYGFYIPIAILREKPVDFTKNFKITLEEVEPVVDKDIVFKESSREVD